MTRFPAAVARYRAEKILEAAELPWWRFLKRRKLLKQAHNGPDWHSFKSVRREG